MKKISLTLGILVSSLFYANAQCWKTIAAGGNHTLTIKADGTLWAWGYNATGAFGTVPGDPTVPTQVGSDTDWESLSPGLYHSIAIKTNGSVWSWGFNGQAELGNGTYFDKLAPDLLTTINNVSSIVGKGERSHAIKNDGSLWGWGHNEGLLGDGTIITWRNSPVRIGLGNNWLSVSTGIYHSLALKTDGTLWAWGGGTYGQLGNGISGNKIAPVQIGSATDWKIVSSGRFHSLAVKNNGTLWTWGYNSKGQLGDGTYTDKNIPTQISTATDWKFVAGGNDNSFAIKTDGTLWSWGYNLVGQLGDGTNTDRDLPVQIGFATDWKFISAGSDHVIAIKTDNTVWTWGSNLNGELGIGNNTFMNIPVQVRCERPLPVVLLYFKAQKQNGGALLTWQTASEQNSKEYQIERSADGIVFNEVDVIVSDNRLTGSRYIFKDTDPQSGYNYYRLKSVDIDGNNSYSKINVLLFDNVINYVNIYPNPAKNILTIESNFSGEVIHLIITDIAGRKIYYAVKSNKKRIEIPTTNLNKGIYLLTISDVNTIVSKKIIKE